MTKDLRYRTTDELILKLREQSLIIEDEEFARNALEEFGYSNLIKSYRDPYVFKDADGKKRYRDGVTFEQVYSLYTFDKNLRAAVMYSMLDYEEHLKVFASHTVADKFGTHQDEYLQFRNYRDRKTKKQQFSLSSILNRMENTLKTTKDPIRHYFSKYGQVPPWILFKSVYFGTIINFIDLFKTEERRTMAMYLYSDSSNIPPEELDQIMRDTMFLANEYRNLAAHGGRIYNHKCSYQTSSTGEMAKAISSLDGLSRLFFSLSLLKNKSHLNTLEDALNTELSRHCSRYPQDVTYLGEVLQMNISRTETSGADMV